MTKKTWIFVSCDFNDIDVVYTALTGVYPKVAQIRGIWDFVVELSDHPIPKHELDFIKSLYGVQTTQILTEI